MMTRKKHFVLICAVFLGLFHQEGYTSKAPAAFKKQAYQKEFRENDYRGTGVPRFRILQELRASASGQFSKDQLAMILSTIVSTHQIHPSQVYVIDLRQEAHLFADGIPFTITDKHESPSKFYQHDLEKDIQNRLKAADALLIEPRVLDQDIKKHYEKKQRALPKEHHAQFLKRNHHRFWVNQPILLKKPWIQTEEELAERFSVQYIRLPLKDHTAPSLEDLLKFAEIISSLPQGAWVHIHCRGGEGRSTSLMAVIEMIRFPDRGFEEILKHQHDKGGKNLLKIPPQPWRQDAAIKRVNTLREFYRITHQN